ncbi:hypothetical protein V2G26_008523 [Clonostachys chloroleuca]
MPGRMHGMSPLLCGCHQQLKQAQSLFVRAASLFITSFPGFGPWKHHGHMGNLKQSLVAQTLLPIRLASPVATPRWVKIRFRYRGVAIHANRAWFIDLNNGVFREL